MRRVPLLLAFVALLVLAFGQVLALVPTPAPVVPATPTPVPQHVVTNNPKLGVHTRLTDEEHPERIMQTFEMVREMGAAWAVEYFPWSYIQADSRAHFSWTHADLVVDAAAVQGVTLVARLDGVPGWARPPGTTWRYLDPDHYADYAAFVAAFVARYHDKVRYIILWNEPNLSSEWGVRPPDPVAFTALLRAGYAAAKGADPTITVLMGGLASVPWSSESAMQDSKFLQGVYDAGGGAAFDMLALHPYGYNNSPTAPAVDSEQGMNFARATVLREVMVRNGDAAKGAMITEAGWNDSPRWIWSVRPAQRIAYTLAAYEQAQRDWPWCVAVAVWAFRLPAPAYTYMDGYTFVTPDFIPKPIYYEVQKYATGAEK